MNGNLESITQMIEGDDQEFYVPVLERDTRDPLLSSGPMVVETLLRSSDLNQVTNFALRLSKTYGTVHIFRLVKVCEVTTETHDSSDDLKPEIENV